MFSNKLIFLIIIPTILFAKMDFEKRGKWLNLLPLGVGQYQNYQHAKALSLFAGESLLLGTAVVSAFAASNGGSKTFEKVELYSFISFMLLYSWGVYDAFENYDKADEHIIKGFKKLSLVPVIFPDGGLISMVLKF